MRQTIGAEIGLARFLQMHGMRNLSFTLHFSSILRPALCALAIVLTLADARPAMAGGVPDCEAMATRIGAAEGLPPGLLPAISRIESGRRVGRIVRAWPWTLNHAGRGLYFETREEALAYLRQTVAEGSRNIDVGCMQVNHYWHGENFPSVEAMLDPETNIRYAVRFLKELHARKGSWEAAVKHYHSAEPSKNVAYHRRVLAELERFMADSLPASPASDVVMVETAAANPDATADTDTMLSMPEVGSTDLALVTRAPANLPAMVTPPSDADPSQPEIPASAVVPNIAAPPTAAPTASGNGAPAMAEDLMLAKQPNLAPHRHRVEHFRRLLAQQAN